MSDTDTASSSCVGLRPCIDIKRASELFVKYYWPDSVEIVDIHEMKAHEDRNFKITVRLFATGSQSACRTPTTLCCHWPVVGRERDEDGSLLAVFVLKVSLTSAGDVCAHTQLLKKQFELMNYVHKMGFVCSMPIANKYGNYYEIEMTLSDDDSSQQMCIVYALTYLEGKTLFDLYLDTGIPNQVRHEAGTLLAFWRTSLKGYPEDNVMSSGWALDNASELKQQLDILQNSGKEQLVSDILDIFEEQVLVNMESLEKGMLHGDFHDENIICLTSEMTDGSRSSGSSSSPLEDARSAGHNAPPADVLKHYGVIDFSDAGYGPFLFDLATSVAFFMISAPETTLGIQSTNDSGSVEETVTDGGWNSPDAGRPLTARDPDFIDAGGQFLSGYTDLCPLSCLEWSLLYACVCTAYCRELVIAERDFRLQGSTNRYLLTSVYSGWRQLTVLWTLGKDDVTRRWQAKCTPPADR